MSLVAYDSSDESSEDEGNNSNVASTKANTETESKQTNDKLCLPIPKYNTPDTKVNENNEKIDITIDASEKIHFEKLPKPKNLNTEAECVVEEDDIPPKKEQELKPEKPIKKDRAPVKITVPSLSEFKDLEEENETKANRIKPSSKGTKLFSLLPPPKAVEKRFISNLIPMVVNKAPTKPNQLKDRAAKDMQTKKTDISKGTKDTIQKSSIGISYDSNSEDEDDAASSSGKATMDFFALTETDTKPIVLDAISNPHLKYELSNLDSSADTNTNSYLNDSSTEVVEETDISNPQKTLVSNVMNLPKEEILLKNKAEVGPKLPIPEQEYNIDTEGNVAFDEKAIEYLCGRRGVKRKNKEIDEANIIEINGEDIKPDEREWLVKALTEEPIQRPVSMQGGGVNSQSKKKHQITYLAHQAKAMEMELKNQWAQNRMTRKQTQSKYGF